MPRKKTEPKKVKIQKQKQQQKQVVNVVVNQPVKRTRRRYVRKQVVEREPEISAKQLTPVIIQQPVLSQSIPPPPSYPFVAEPKKEVKSAIDVFENLKPQAEPLFTPKKDYLSETEFITPVVEGEKLTNEGHGIFFQENLKDVALNDKKDNFQKTTLANIDNVAPSFELDENRDIAAIMNKAYMDIGQSLATDLENIEKEKKNIEKQKKVYKVREPGEKLINNFRLYAKDQDFVNNKTDIEIKNFIKGKMTSEKLTAEEFNRKYTIPKKKAKMERDIKNYKVEQYNILFGEKPEKKGKKVGQEIYEMVQSTTK